MINKVIYHNGDVIDAALSDQYHIFAHGCNCFNTMGAGVALQVKNRIPSLYQTDQACGFSPQNRLGTVSFVPNKHTWFFNLYTQYDHGTEKRQFNYGAFVNSMHEALIHRDEDEIPTLKVCMPRIGAGLAGGDWEIIEELLMYTEFEHFVEFHVYDFG